MSFDISGIGSVDSYPQYPSESFTYTQDGQTYYGFRCYVNSLQMADTITAVLYSGNQNVSSCKISAKDYLDYMIKITSSDVTSADYKLMVAIKDYGHYAQTMLAARHNFTLGDGGYAVMDRGSSRDYTAEEIFTISRDSATDAISVSALSGSGITNDGISYSLNLDASTAINLYFTMSDDFSGTVKVSSDNIDDADLEVTNSDKKYTVKIKNIPAHELNEKYSLSINAAKTVSVSVSALSYVNSVLTNETYAGDNKQKNAVVALYKYWYATTAYRQAHNYK